MIVTGVDVGNATTEVVLTSLDGDHRRVLGVRRRATVGVKGGLASLRAAARLVYEAEGAAGVDSDLLAIAHIRPAAQRTMAWPTAHPERAVGVWHLDLPSLATRAGSGVAAGVLRRLDDVASDGEVIAVASADESFEVVAERINDARERGARVVGVLLRRDEAVLVARRLRGDPVPVVDEVEVPDDALGRRAAIEVGDGGLRHLTDPVWIARRLGLDERQSSSLVALCARLAEDSCAVLVRRSTSELAEDVGHLECDDGTLLDLRLSAEELGRRLAPGHLRRIHAGSNRALADLDPRAQWRDFFAAPLAAHARVSFALLGESAALDAASTLASLSGRPTEIVGDEASAARRGALSTPGASPASIVVDIGGGTVDVAHGSNRLTAAGAGDLVTATIADQIAVPRAIAELAKQFPAWRLESPHVATSESGERLFLDEPAPGRAVGWLCVRPSPSEFVPISDRLGAGEWRERRRDIKTRVLGASIERALAHLPDDGADLLMSGGGACDDEVVSAVSARLPGRVVGRADVAGQLGPRWAVAWGLTELAAASLDHSRTTRSD